MNSLIRALAAIALCHAIAACSNGGTAGSGAPTRASAPLLSHSGRWLTDGDGRVVMLHGFNMVAKLPPYTAQSVGFGADDAAFLAENGFNAVRVGMMWKSVEPEPGVYDDAYLDQIADTVETLGRENIYSLVDFHQDSYNEAVGGQGFPDWTVNNLLLGVIPAPSLPVPVFDPAQIAVWDNFWANGAAPDGVALWERFGLFWQHVAARFRDSEWVAGYDLLNEPIAGSYSALCANPLVCPFDSKLGEFYQAIIPMLRVADPEHLVWYEPNLLSGAGGAMSIDIGGEPNAVLSFHNYCIATALSSGQVPPPLRQPVCPVSENIVFDAAEAQAARNGDALVMTEFGSVPVIEEVVRVASAADQNRVGWTEWTYYNTGHTNFAGSYSIVLDPQKPPVGDNVDVGLLTALARPYPQTVAGTPQSWSFDPQSRSFSLDYTNARADGQGSFAAGAETIVAVPRIQYPDGYAIEVSGAQALSAPGAVLLRLESCAGATAISLRLTPGSGVSGGCS